MECLKNGASLVRLPIGTLVLAVLVFFSARVEEVRAACNVSCMTFKANSVTIQPDAKLNNLYYQYVNDCINELNNDSVNNLLVPQGLVANNWKPCTSTQVCPFSRQVGTSGIVVYLLGQAASEPTDVKPQVPVNCRAKCVNPPGSSG